MSLHVSLPIEQKLRSSSLVLANDFFSAAAFNLAIPFQLLTLFPVSSHFRPPLVWVEEGIVEETESEREREREGDRETKRLSIERE